MKAPTVALCPVVAVGIPLAEVHAKPQKGEIVLKLCPEDACFRATQEEGNALGAHHGPQAL
jgi:hypothetical protein